MRSMVGAALAAVDEQARAQIGGEEDHATLRAIEDSSSLDCL